MDRTVGRPNASVGEAAHRQPRGARRKQATRMRLLQAAFRLMAEKGRDNVAISEITEAADVGFGSFYYHFESKDGVFAALTEWVFDDFADGRASRGRLVGSRRGRVRMRAPHAHASTP